jgi:HK97 family phage prohead protease
MDLEKRASAAKPELRATASTRTATGYAVVYNSETVIGGWYREIFASGAFSESLKTADVRALVDHDHGRVIGRTSSGTLRLSDNMDGLQVEIDLPDTTDGRDLGVLLERGDISGMSFAFVPVIEEWDESGEVPLRTIKKADIFEVSAVAFPAYPDTSLAMRSLFDAREKAQKRHNFNAASMRIRNRNTLAIARQEYGDKA